MRRFTTLLTALAVLLGLAASAPAQDRVRAKEVVVAFAAEPRTLLPNTIVDWTTNNRSSTCTTAWWTAIAKTYKPSPMLATGWKVVNDTTWEFTLRRNVKFHNGEVFDAAVREGHHGLHQGPREQDPLHAALGPGEGGPDRQRLHRALRHREAVARPHRPHRGAPTSSRCRPRRSRSRACRRSRQADRHRGLPLRAVGPRREARGRAQPGLLAERRPRSNRVTFRFIPEFSARLAALLAGEIDIMKDVPPAERGDARQERQGQAARHRVLPHQLPGAGEPQAGADAGHPGAQGDPRRGERGRADPAGAQGPRHQDVRARSPRSTWTTRPSASARSTTPRGPRPSSRKRASTRPSCSSRSTPRPGATRSTRTSRSPSRPSSSGSASRPTWW